MSLDFLFLAEEPSLEAWGVRFELSSEEEIANILAPGPEIKKVRTLCFLRLLKLKKRKWP